MFTVIAMYLYYASIKVDNFIRGIIKALIYHINCKIKHILTFVSSAFGLCASVVALHSNFIIGYTDYTTFVF